MQRALKFAKYLPEFGWLPTVLTVRPEDAAYPDVDPELAREVPSEVEVVRTPAWDPYALYARLLGKEKSETVSVGFLGAAEENWKQRLARWLRANLFLPDARIGWVPFAAARGGRLLDETHFDALLTTGPPHSVHLTGILLARRSGLPWVVDFRDPWVGIDYYAELPMTALARRIDAGLEQAVLNRADLCLTVSAEMKASMSPRAQCPFEVIENGFDPADFAVEAEPASDRFVLSHVGNMNVARNPVALWRAMERLRTPERMPELELSLVGNVDPAVLEDARSRGLDVHLARHPYVPHDEAVRHMRQSALLLLSINRVEGAGGITTGKVYEYVASGRPVLGIGPPGGNAADVLQRSGAGRVFDFDDADGIAAALEAHYEAWKAGSPKPGATPESAAPFSRRGQAEQLARHLDLLVARR